MLANALILIPVEQVVVANVVYGLCTAFLIFCDVFQ
jgi:hypothetical protein